MTLSVEVIEDEAELSGLHEEWDRLAVETGRPFCAPAWMLAWWRRARPDGAGLKVFAVEDGDRLVGLAPLWTLRPATSARSVYEVLTSRLSPPVGPLLEPGRGSEVATSLAEAISAARPRLKLLRLRDRYGPEEPAGMLVENWPGRRPWVNAATVMPAPVILLDGLDYDGWLATRSSKFRQESRRLRRRLIDEGGEFQLVGPEGVGRAVAAFLELHESRWDDRGGSNALVAGLGAMLGDAAAELVPSGRMRIFTIEVAGRIVAANVMVAAGGVVGGWSSGFDAEWGRYSPSMLLTLHAIADATERGDARISLGPGDTSYKRRLTDELEEIRVLALVPHGGRYPLVRLGQAGRQLRWALSNRLSPKAKIRLRRLSGS